MRVPAILAGFSLLCFQTTCAQTAEKAVEPPPGMKALRDLNYAGTSNWRQTLDLFVHEKPTEKPQPLIVFIHGGGWEGGSKNNGGVLSALIKDSGYIGATINYRLTNEGGHPNQIHDCKAAIRWLRAHAKEHNIDKDKIAVFGISAGGHLCSLLGVSAGVRELDGAVGAHTDESARVSCVVNFCGPADFLTFGGQGSVIDPEDASSAVGKLVGGKISERQGQAKNASPVQHISKDDAPFLHIHGTKDNIVPYAQAKEFDEKLDATGIPSTLLSGEGGPHVFFSADMILKIRAFISHHLLGTPEQVSEGPVAVQ
jgi:acetyl esterase/lipase